MFLNEHLSKKLFGEAGIAVPQGLLLTPDTIEVPEGMEPPWFLKAQVLTGGRGKAGVRIWCRRRWRRRRRLRDG